MMFGRRDQRSLRTSVFGAVSAGGLPIMKGWHLRGGDWIHGWDGRGLRVLCKAECSDITDM